MELKRLKTEIENLKKINKLQASALNIAIMAYWKLYYEAKSFPTADSIRRIEKQKEEWKYS